MMNIIKCGKLESLLKMLGKEEFTVVNIGEIHDEQTIVAIKEEEHCNYKLKVTYQILEVDEDNMIEEINVVSTELKLV